MGEATYAAKIEPQELQLDWSRPAEELHRVVRVGGAWTTFRGGRLKIHRSARAPAAEPVALSPGTLDGVRVAAGDGCLELVEVQPEGRARQPAEAWRNGARPTATDRLGH
ncbi:hypothetical protein BH20ACT2_BH20ACT2_25390 [soil metagenome]